MELSVLQWNIWYKEKIEDIATFLTTNKADIICLQELSIGNPEQSVKNAVTYIAKQLGYEYVHQEITYENNDMKLANAIFTRYPVIDSRTTWINEPRGTGNYDDEYRAYVELDLDVNGKPLSVGTVHMSYTNSFQTTPRKLEETSKLLDFIAKRTRNFIITGDFNAEPDSEVIMKLNERLVNVGPDYNEKTWTTKPFSYNGFEATVLDWRLDYIFSTSDILSKRAEILKTNLSDHLPIIATFFLV